MGDRFTVEVGAPEYRPGEQVLVFLDREANGEWTTLDLALGQFRFEVRRGSLILERKQGEINGWDMDGARHLEQPRSAVLFLQRIRDLVSAPTASMVEDAQVLVPLVNNLNTAQAAQIAVSAWTSDPGSTVNYSLAGSAASGDSKGDDGQDRIIVDDPHNSISGTFNGSGVVATAFYGGGGTNSKGGKTYTTITYSDVVVQDGVSSSTLGQNNYNTAMTHEVGHTLGFRHSNQDQTNNPSSHCSAPLDCSSGAVMNSNIVGGLNGSLQAWDVAAVRALYGSGTDSRIYDDSRNSPRKASQQLGRLLHRRSNRPLLHGSLHQHAAVEPDHLPGAVHHTVGGGIGDQPSVPVVSRLEG